MYAITFMSSNSVSSNSAIGNWLFSNKKDAINFVKSSAVADRELVDEAIKNNFLSDIILHGDKEIVVNTKTGDVVFEKQF